LLKPADFKPDSPFFRYRLAGKPRSQEKGAQLQEQLKTVQDEVYLPGSSLKGAIRTALAWHGWAELGLKVNKSDLERNRKYAGQSLEKQIMGPDPNHDLLRALHISDSAPAGKDRLLVLNAQVVTRGSLGSPIELEAVQPDTPFHLTIKVDRALFNQWAKNNRLRLGGNPEWLGQLSQLIQNHTAQRLKTELGWFKGRPGAEQTADFYRQLSQAQLPPQSCLLQVGWGTGWGDKTFGSHLQADQRLMEYLIGEYHLAIGQRKPGDPFPKSRRSTVRVIKDASGQTQQRPGLPLGWVLLEMKER
jgi:CRISPR-associated protein Csm5